MAAGNPTLPTLTEGAANALSATLDARTGQSYRTHGASKSTSPKGTTEGTAFEDQLHALIEKVIGGQVVETATGGLFCGVFKLYYRIGGTDYTFPGETAFALTASVANHLYIDTSETLKTQAGSWPAGDIFRVAIVTTDGAAITGIEPSVGRNYQIGVVNNWDDILPDNDVDMDGYGFNDVGALAGRDWTELTIAAGVITPTQLFHTIDTEADAASDDLVTITAVAGSDNRRLLIVTNADITRTVNIKTTGNIKHVSNDDVLPLTLAGFDFVVLVQDSDTTWSVVSHTLLSSYASTNVEMNTFDIWELGILSLGGGGSVPTATIASGSITPVGSLVDLRTEGGGPTDTLDDIVSTYTDGQVLILHTSSATQNITVTEGGAGSGPIILAGGKDCVLNDTAVARGRYNVLVLIRVVGVWIEVARSQPLLSSFEGGLEGIPTPGPGACIYPGALSLNQNDFNAIVTEAFTLKSASGYVLTAPSGGSCVIDVKKNGASIFAADVNRINITTGTNSDTSDVVDEAFAQGDRLTVEVVTGPFAAADLTVTFNGRSAILPP